MKISPSAGAKAIVTPLKSDHKGLISFIPTNEDQDIPLERCMQLQLYTDPANKDTSTKHWINVRALHRDETVDQLVRWQVKIKRILEGLGADDYGKMKPLVEMLLVGTPLATFKIKLKELKQERFDRRRLEAPTEQDADDINTAGIKDNGNKHVDNISKAIEETLKQLMPHRALCLPT